MRLRQSVWKSTQCICPNCNKTSDAYRISSVIRRSFFSFQNNTKDLDPSYKTDLDLWYCLGMGKIGIKARFHRTDLIN